MNALQILNRAVQACEDDAGVTIHVDTGLQPSTGFGVSNHTDRERILSDRPTGQDLLAYVEDNIDLLEDPNYYLWVRYAGDYYDFSWHLNVLRVFQGPLASLAMINEPPMHSAAQRRYRTIQFYGMETD